MRIATLLSGVAVLACGALPLAAQPAPAQPAPKGAAVAALAAEPQPSVIDATGPVTKQILPNADARPGTAAVPTLDGAGTKAEEAPPTADAEPAGDKVPETREAKADPAPAEEENEYSDGIAATVNDESISDYELRQRMGLFLATSGIKPTEEERKRIRAQMLEQLENEKIQLQEAVKKKVTVSPTEVDRAINRLLDENHITIEQLRTTLGRAGATEEALRAQITAQIAWQKVVRDEYGDRPVVTPAQVDQELRRYAEGAGKPHYLVSEIFIPVDNPEQDGKVRKDAENIENQIHMGAPFPMVARQFSQNPTAATNGDIGWVHEGQLAPELSAQLTKMEPGQVSPPVRSVGGYYLLWLRERQEPLGTKIVQAPTAAASPDGTLPLARMLLPLAPNTPQDELEKVMKVAAQVRGTVQSCEQLAKVHDEMKGSVYMDLGSMKLAELSPQIREALSQTKPGEIAPPFTSDAGVEIIARCDKRVPVLTAYKMPTRDEVEDQLFEQQISALARRYMRDLKRDANVQVR
jgi:peptidyl-prolyl cis-trans isomerase SurA